MGLLDFFLKQGLVPEPVIRLGIRSLLAQTLRQKKHKRPEVNAENVLAFAEELKTLPIAIETNAANQQHYEVPAAFFTYVLGRHKKYSSGFWNADTKTLDQAEALMLQLTCDRAELENGQHILELGCGWGSLTLWMAEQFPDSQITAVSNSASQKTYIEHQAQRHQLTNINVITANMLHFDTEHQFDRIVSVEMFEHMKNYEQLFARVAKWLKPETGRLFVHVFTHKEVAYHYEDAGEKDWLTRYFFSGGTMPSNDLFSHFQTDVRLLQQWEVNGTHYQKTAEAWLNNLKENQEKVMPILAQTYGSKQANQWFHQWAIFFMACAELWGYRKGTEWMVCHYLFAPQPKKVSFLPPNTLEHVKVAAFKETALV